MGFEGSHKAALALLALAALGWYLSTRAAADVLAGKGKAPGRRAVAMWLPTVVLVILAIIDGRPEVAVGIPFATSVACGTLVFGIVTIAARHAPTERPKRPWAFVLPTALIMLLIGFSGGIRWYHAAILLLQGVALLLLWNEAEPARRDEPAPSNLSRLRVAQLIAAVAAAGVSAWAGLRAADGISRHLELPSSALAAALMLSPALILPLIGTSSLLASEGRYDEAVSTLVGFVLLNLCALLPLATAGWLTRPYWHPGARQAENAAVSATQSTTRDAPQRAVPQALPSPLAIWRADTVILIALGLLLFPVAAGRWSLGLAEGVALIFAYVLYMGLTAVLAR
jgi:Ca2+/Na+ antiporter